MIHLREQRRCLGAIGEAACARPARIENAHTELAQGD